MVIFIENGRLGNQLFQYVALKSFSPDSPLILCGFDSFRNVFEDVDDHFIVRTDSFWYLVCNRLLRNFLNFFAYKCRLIGSGHEVMKNKCSSLCRVKGIIPNVYFISNGFFQAEKYIGQKIVSDLHLKSCVLQSATNIVNSLPVEGKTMIFVHVRRGDYISWPSKKHPAVIPSIWYMEVIEKLRGKYLNPYFLIFGDDHPYMEEIFGNLEESWVSHNDEVTDFAIMTMCDAGILSASSFAWWAAYFANRRTSTGEFIAPLYWAGFRQGKWHPLDIETSWLHYIPI